MGVQQYGSMFEKSEKGGEIREVRIASELCGESVVRSSRQDEDSWTTKSTPERNIFEVLSCLQAVL